MCRENQNTHFMLNNFFPKIRDNVEKFGRDGEASDDNTIGRMSFACWVTKVLLSLSLSLSLSQNM